MFLSEISVGNSYPKMRFIYQVVIWLPPCRRLSNRLGYNQAIQTSKAE